MLNKLTRSWQLFLTSLQVVRLNRKLLLFPLVTLACTLVVVLFFIAPALLYPSGHTLLEAAHWQALGAKLGFDFDGARPRPAGNPNGLFYAYTAILYLVSMFLATFANVAFYHEILEALAGKPVSIRAGIRFAFSRIGSILVWSLFAGLVGLIIKNLEERFGWIGQWVMKLVGVIWSVASVFAIPVIIREGGTNPLVVLRNSASTLRRTWGESLVGYVGVTVGSWVILGISIAYLALVIVLVGFFHFPVVLGFGAMLLWLAAILALAYLVSVTGHVFRCALYVYASEGAIPAPYTAEMMDAAWKVKKS